MKYYKPVSLVLIVKICFVNNLQVYLHRCGARSSGNPFYRSRRSPCRWWCTVPRLHCRTECCCCGSRSAFCLRLNKQFKYETGKFWVSVSQSLDAGSERKHLFCIGSHQSQSLHSHWRSCSADWSWCICRWSTRTHPSHTWELLGGPLKMQSRTCL